MHNSSFIKDQWDVVVNFITLIMKIEEFEERRRQCQITETIIWVVLE